MVPRQSTELDSPARQAAVEWVSRLALGEVTAKELASLKAWLAADPCHQAEFDIARQKWADLKSLRPEKAAASRPRWGAWAAAACVVAFSILQIFRTHDVSSSVGEIRETTLADGSRLWLDTDSAVDFDQTATARSLHVVRGRIHIAVANDQQRPLTVEAAGYVVRDIGTSFSVDLAGDGLRVAVVDGAVEVSRDGVTTLLTAMQAASFTEHRVLASAPLDIVSEKAWREGRILFADTSLDTVLAEIDRYRKGTVWLSDAAMGKKVLSGSIPTDDLESGLDALAETAGLRLVRLPYLLVVLPAE
ncbi:FecR family protein [Steroidobacter flavus]|uniref:FecR family protein n=1 Tax=Steroidobacter flavus TaxID=1842136 RepID=A0ABV8SW19_9GAMM